MPSYFICFLQAPNLIESYALSELFIKKSCPFIESSYKIIFLTKDTIGFTLIVATIWSNNTPLFIVQLTIHNFYHWILNNNEL